MDKPAKELFDYLQNLLYAPKKACLDLDALGEENRQLGEGMQFVGNCILEARAFAEALAVGNLSAPLPSPQNELAAPLKALHASLKHLAWQSQQVAKGDYQQRVDFLGEFADAFNTMTAQLDQRQTALEKEIQNTRRKTRALEQSNSLLEAIMHRIPQWIVVMSLESDETVFLNNSAAVVLDKGGLLADSLRSWVVEQTHRMADGEPQGPVELRLAGEKQVGYYSVVSYPIQWKGLSAVAHVFTDVSAERERVHTLEGYAFQDMLTSIPNRHYGMQVLEEWAREGRGFCICFADLDNLKYVNDSFGHKEGDRFLIMAARVLMAFCEGCVASRLGGDEFMVLAEGFTYEQAAARMAEMSALLHEQSEEEKLPYKYNISYGIVEVESGRSMDVSALLSLADERMYQYKRARKRDDFARRGPAEDNVPPGK